MTKLRLSIALATALLASSAVIATAVAGPEEQACLRELASARSYAATLPSGDLSRRFAETELNTAETELNSGEVEDCAPAIARARSIVRQRPYRLRPGETLGVTGLVPGDGAAGVGRAR